MMKRMYFIFSFVLIVASFVFSIVLYPALPEKVATHWNIHGEVDSYGSKSSAAFMMPIINVVILTFFVFLNWLSPQNYKVDTFRPTWEFVMFLTVGLLTYDHVVFLLASRGWLANVSQAMLAGLFLFIGLLGNVLGKVRRNFWIGIRTPWTLASERVWNDTHRFAAKLFVIAGVLGFIAAISGVHTAVAIGILAAAALGSILYSLIEYKRLEKENQV